MNQPLNKLRIGVAIHHTTGQPLLWSNEEFQTAAFLALALSGCDGIKRATLVNTGDDLDAATTDALKQAGLATIRLPEALMTADILIQCSAIFPAQALTAFRQKGGRLVWFRPGNELIFDMERAMYKKPPGQLSVSGMYDAIWTWPFLLESCADYFGIVAKAPVQSVPHVWSPLFLHAAEKFLPAGTNFGYQPGKPRWRASCHEPNTSIVRSYLTPLLICEQAYRRNPRFLDVMRVCNTTQAKDHYMFQGLAKRLDIVNQAATSFEGSLPFFEFMAHYGDCVISHHWGSGLCHMYYEALHGGYPLIHNSEHIKDYGYYYPGFDCEKGGELLLHAFEMHDAELENYRAHAQTLLHGVSPGHSGNRQAFSAALRSLYQNQIEPCTDGVNHV